MKIDGIPGEVTFSRTARFLISCGIVDVAYYLRYVLTGEKIFWLLSKGHLILDEEDRKVDDIGKKATEKYFRLQAMKIINKAM